MVSNAIPLIARLLLQHQQAFEQLLGNAAASNQQQQGQPSTPEDLLAALVRVWCDAFDSIAQPLARKLAACGLAALIGFPVEVGSVCFEHVQFFSCRAEDKVVISCCLFLCIYGATRRLLRWASHRNRYVAAATATRHAGVAVSCLEFTQSAEPSFETPPPQHAARVLSCHCRFWHLAALAPRVQLCVEVSVTYGVMIS